MKRYTAVLIDNRNTVLAGTCITAQDMDHAYDIADHIRPWSWLLKTGQAARTVCREVKNYRGGTASGSITLQS